MTEALFLLAMALTAYATRVGGLLAARRVSLEGRVKAFLDTASTAIVASLLVVALAQLSWQVWIGTAAAMVVMRSSGRMLASMIVAVLTTSILRSLF